jgi:glucose-6-phosphate isomerase
MKLPSFTLDQTRLWDKSAGPRWDDSTKKLVENAHTTLQTKLKDGSVGFYDWPVTIKDEELRTLETLSNRIKESFEGALIFGIGGSYLGPAAILAALNPGGHEDFRVHWLSNVDPGEIRRAEMLAAKHRLASVVMSKSGGTVETLSSFFHLSDSLDARGYVCVTDPEVGELRRLGTANNWHMLDIAPNIGGRFSVLTAIGLFPTLLGNLSAEKLLAGARAMREALESATPAENPAYRLAAAKFLWDTKHGHHVHYLMPYEQRLKLLADWYVQLFGESLGKRPTAGGDPVGFTPASALGTTDQHSLLQLFKEGPADKLVGFVEILRDGDPLVIRRPRFEVKGQDHLFGHHFGEITHFASVATEQSVTNSNMPTYRLQFTEMDETALGAFFFFYETACALAGELYGVDAFNQPGVEEAKKLLREAL